MQRKLYAALPAPAVKQVETQRHLDLGGVRLHLDANPHAPYIHEVLPPASQARMPVVNGRAASRREGRVNLDLRIRERDVCLDVAGVECLDGVALELDVLPRHRYSLRPSSARA